MKIAETTSGTTPPGTENEEQAASWVRQMFAAVAPRYDLLNHLLSFNVDKGWRKRLIAQVRPALASPDAVILDLCCGTGDVLLEMQQHAASNVVGADFCHPMLVRASDKISARKFRSRLFEGDASAAAFARKLARSGYDCIRIPEFRELSRGPRGAGPSIEAGRAGGDS